MKLTRERLAEWRTRWACNCVLDDAEIVDKLLDFAEEMLPLREALRIHSAARKNLSGNTQEEYIRATEAYWKAIRELAETETEP